MITEPMPSMPIFFWNDPGGERLRESYFSTYPGVWRHGDWIEITERGTAIIYGRSDSTINRGGIRMGTSEIYRAVLGIDEIVDALVVDVPVGRRGGDSWMPLFVVLREGAKLDAALTGEIAKRVREECSPRHVPNDVFAIAEVPRTLSGKLLEVPVKRILMGTPVEKAASRDSLQNPAALDPFVDLAQGRVSAARRTGKPRRVIATERSGSSLWTATGPRLRSAPPLERDRRFDVAVLGGGIVGATAALLLAREGLSVGLIEAHRVGHGVSGYSTAKVTSQHKTDLLRAVVELRRGDRRRLRGGAGGGAGADRRLRRGARDRLRPAAQARVRLGGGAGSRWSRCARRRSAARAAGLPAAFTEETDLPWQVAGAVRFDHQAEFHPVKYLVGLARAAREAGAEVFHDTRAVGADDGEPCRVRTEGGHTVTAGHVIVATHIPFLDRGGYFARTHPERSYAIAASIEGPVPQGMYISAEGHSLRSHPQGGEELLLVGGEGHKVGQADEADRVRRLEAWAHRHFRVRQVHCALVEPGQHLDRRPALRRPARPFSKRLLTATGFRKWGFTNGAIAARCWSMRCSTVPIRGRPRSTPTGSGPPSSALTFAQGERQRRRPIGRRPAQARSAPRALQPGEGRVVRDGLGQAAVSRDGSGRLHAVSARCTHLGCIVDWNDAEGSWDCPCHGSRFAPRRSRAAGARGGAAEAAGRS